MIQAAKETLILAIIIAALAGLVWFFVYNTDYRKNTRLLKAADETGLSRIVLVYDGDMDHDEQMQFSSTTDNWKVLKIESGFLRTKIFLQRR